ncbi:hypothetical protein MIC97_16605 [Aquamicrobium sp. NLF2-7]|uniref:hypothetical protein n=1 Tax=Aquamicrobium sp. NLF2-7 TaxID=2918753 RepID=UPI001EFA7B41|nr:hypothetical protein [Aquamicrobium sp. NLF2-7]MCG8273121.1 hypothetical protein [Aquamicrobium sp. NLF2-7]
MNDIESLISGAAASGWEWFDAADDKVKQRLDVRRSLEGEDARAVARAWAEFAATPGGAKALEAMHKATLGRTVFFVNLGLDPMSMAVFGAFREGQNALVHEIFRQIAKGRNEEGPAPRDV